MYGRVVPLIAGALTSMLVLTGCPVRKHGATPGARPTPQSGDARYETPVPTVPPSTPAPMSTRPIPNPNMKATKGKPIGPIITHLGAAKADGALYEPESVGKDGVATYKTAVGSGFIFVVEAKPGLSNYEVSRSIFNYDPHDPTKQPDLQIEADRPLGDGSEMVCDSRRPDIGGVPAVKPASFQETQKVSDALNDLACRFEIFIESSSSCTSGKSGDSSFIKAESTTQFCMLVARAWNFPEGTTVVSARLRDVNGNVGPVKRVKMHRPAESERPKRTPVPAPTVVKPKALPTRE